jgi:cell wall-associated NlpC family hydrolase
MSCGAHRPGLGARLPRLRVVVGSQVVFAVILAGLIVGSATASAANLPEATVRVRAIDGLASTTDANYSTVAARKDTVALQQETSNGDAIVAFAMQYLGYPYVWAGNSPSGFDCSGFTEYVVLNTVGIDIGHGLEGQPSAGAWIDYGAWAPGDLIFFQNTYQAGLSHVGIYIGDGQFIHAENEGTGVVISSIYSDYYGSRYWGSVRVG